MNYIKRSDARGTWLESHFRWQIRTFWFGLIWAVLCGLFVVMTLGIGLIVWLPLGILTLWFIYRVARGWLAARAQADVRVTGWCEQADTGQYKQTTDSPKPDYRPAQPVCTDRVRPLAPTSADPLDRPRSPFAPTSEALDRPGAARLHRPGSTSPGVM